MLNKKGWKYTGNTTRPGKAIWNEYTNEETGESTLEVYTPKEIMSSKGCNHFYERIDRQGNIVCQHCGMGKRIITGMQTLVDGRIKVIKKKI